MATEATHPYIEHWWPPGHIIGYEHSFIHAVADFMTALDKKEKIYPNFNDGVKILSVLEAGLESAKSGQKTEVL